MKKIRLQAHRGVSTEYPENTIVAFQASIDKGYDIIELDTKYTKDGVCVVLHDRTLNRTCRLPDGSKLPDEPKLAIADITLEEARSFDAGIFKGEQFKGEKIPTFAETLEFIKKSPIPYKLDNVWETFTPEQQNDFLGLVKAADLGNKIGFTCRVFECFERVAKEFPECELHWDGSLDDETLANVKKVGEGHRVTIWIRFDNKMTAWCKFPPATPELCDKIRQYGEVGVWILSTEEEFDIAVTELKADSIETTGGVKPWMFDKFVK